MSTTSMSLESLKCLLQHMDANRRFEISNRCPALRETEKSVPLKIKSLSFKSYCVTVNDTTYTIGIIRKYKNGEGSRFVTASNERGGLCYEVDRYGIRDKLDMYTVTPGDVKIESRGEHLLQNEEVYIRRIEHRIQDCEQQIADQRERRPSRNPGIIVQLESVIEAARAKLFDYECRRNNIPPNFEHYLQITTSRTVDKKEQKKSERYIHNKKYSEAMKQLTTVLFGGRTSSIHVKKIELDFVLSILRLPIGIKFYVEHLKLGRAVITSLEALAPILDESSYPLKKLNIDGLSVGYVDNPIVRAAGILRIRLVLTNIVRAVSTITNPVVHITVLKLTEQSFERLIGYWIGSQRPIGSEYTIDLLDREPEFVDETEDILKRLNCVFIDKEKVVFPMSEMTQLKVSYGSFPEFAPTSKWVVRFLTEAIEHC